MKALALVLVGLLAGCAVSGGGYGIDIAWVVWDGRVHCDEQGNGPDCVSATLSESAARAIDSIMGDDDDDQVDEQVE